MSKKHEKIELDFMKEPSFRLDNYIIYELDWYISEMTYRELIKPLGWELYDAVEWAINEL